jgi:tetratricopeptide (TPR) repeat protein
MAPNMAPTPSAPWKKARYSLFTCIALLAICEVAFWMAGVVPLARDPANLRSDMLPIFERQDEIYRTRRAAQNTTFNDQSFLADRPANGLRIFCLGGSSAYGFPWGAAASFSGVLRDLLTAAHPDREVEVINAAGMSYAMHRVNRVADQLLEQRPDLLVVYGGHNEFVDPGRVGRGRLWADKLVAVFSHSRSYSLIDRLLRKSEPARPSSETDLVVRREQTVSYTAEEKRQVIANFTESLRRLVRRSHDRGLTVIVATVPCNLRDWRPERSVIADALTDDEREAWLALLKVGRNDLADGRTEQATKRLLEARDLAPSHAETHYLLGRAFEAQGRWDEAAESYEAACDRDAYPVRRTTAINDAIRLVAEEERAILVDIDRIFVEQSEHGLVGFNLIEDYVHPGLRGHQVIAWHLWDAIERHGLIPGHRAAERALFDRIVAGRGGTSEANSPTWLYNQGVVLQQQGHETQAIVKYRQALELDPLYVGVMLNLAQLLAPRGEIEEAERLAETALKIEPRDAGAQHVRATLYGYREQWQKAADLHRTALELDPNNTDVLVGLGTATAHLGRLDEAATIFERALKQDPRHAEANFNMATVLLARGQSDAATEHLWRALENKRDYAEAHNNLGAVFLDSNEPDEAAEQFREALRIRPDRLDFRYNLGIALKKSGEPHEARLAFERVAELAPDYPGVNEQLRSLPARDP